MATDFTQDSVLYFLQCKGGRVRNGELLAHFKTFLREHENRAHNRELFKQFVTCVAVVKQEEGVSYVVLKKKFRGQAEAITGSHLTKTPGRNREQARARERSPRPTGNRNQERVQDLTQSHVTYKTQTELHVPPCAINQITDKVLLSAGILNNNNVETKDYHFEKPIQSSSPNASEHAPPSVTNTEELSPYKTESKGSDGSGQSFETEWLKGPLTQPELNHKSIYSAELGQSKDPNCQERIFSSPDFQHTIVGVTHPEQVEQLAAQRCSYGVDDHRKPDSAAAAWPLQTPLEPDSRMSSSSPCLSDSPAPYAPPDPELRRSNGSLPRPEDGVSDIHVTYPGDSRVAQPQRRSLPLESYHTPAAAGGGGYTEHHQAGLSSASSHSSLLLLPSSADSEWPQSSPREEWTSDEALNYRCLSGEQVTKVHEMLRRAQEAKLLSHMHRAERRVTPWHHSTGQLHDNEEPSGSTWHHSTGNLHDNLELSGSAWHHSTGHLHDNEEPSGSTWHHSTGHLHDNLEPSGSAWHHSMGHLHDSEQSRVISWHHSADHLHDNDQARGSLPRPAAAAKLLLRPSARRITSKYRSRMCRSMGADLDQPFHDDSLSSRHNRLVLLSSSLSIRYPASTPGSRTHSCRDLTAASAVTSSGKSQSSAHDSYHNHRHHHLVPLEPTEHEWMVKGASGTWTEIYALFREDPSLLTKRDFVTGYTVLHWIAKHGDHRVLNTLWYGVNKVGLELDVDAKTTCGYTPLHLAAIHGHKKLLRLLVHKFKANVSLRDTSGKKAWFYLGRGGPRDLLHLLGAPQSATATGGSKGGSPSYSSAERTPTRPVTTSSAVKRSSSIAAFLKHKSLMKFPGHHSSDTFV